MTAAAPSTSLNVINNRLDLVTHFMENEELQERIVILLRRTYDSHRLLQKFAFGRGEADDLIALSNTIRATCQIAANLREQAPQPPCMRDLLSQLNLDETNDLATKIREAIDEDGVSEQHRIEEGEAGEMQALAQAMVEAQGSSEDAKIVPKKKKAMNLRESYAEDSEAWIMQPGASRALSTLHKELLALKEEKDNLVESLSRELSVSTLTLRLSPSQGYICHVRGKDASSSCFSSSSSSDVRTVSLSKSTRSFHHPAWTKLSLCFNQTRTHIRAEEQRIFRKLRTAVLHNIVALRRNATVLDSLDIASSFAVLASSRRWVRPILNDSCTSRILSGSHPVVEASLAAQGYTFTSNDMILEPPRVSLHIITGPNMAGKSTYLRQNALITILAQIGCYVPAAFAELGIVDQIYSRVGAADDLARNRSTFMVEMMETGAILRGATKRSFVVMDEVGRGTTPREGQAVAFATVKMLVENIGCRALFATHFHGVVDLCDRQGVKGVGKWCTDVQDLDDESRSDDDRGSGRDRQGKAHRNVWETGVPFRYVHKLREGVNRQSHALRVAERAQLPREAIAIAAKVLQAEEDAGAEEKSM